jgi:hypothetical protein
MEILHEIPGTRPISNPKKIVDTSAAMPMENAVHRYLRWLGEDLPAKYLFLESRLFSRDPDFFLEIPTFFSRFLTNQQL